jgi:hypothetical protein
VAWAVPDSHRLPKKPDQQTYSAEHGQESSRTFTDSKTHEAEGWFGGQSNGLGYWVLGEARKNQNPTGRLHSQAVGYMLSVGRKLETGMPVQTFAGS